MLKRNRLRWRQGMEPPTAATIGDDSDATSDTLPAGEGAQGPHREAGSTRREPTRRGVRQPDPRGSDRRRLERSTPQDPTRHDGGPGRHGRGFPPGPPLRVPGRAPGGIDRRFVRPAGRGLPRVVDTRGLCRRGVRQSAGTIDPRGVQALAESAGAPRGHRADPGLRQGVRVLELRGPAAGGLEVPRTHGQCPLRARARSGPGLAGGGLRRQR